MGTRKSIVFLANIVITALVLMVAATSVMIIDSNELPIINAVVSIIALSGAAVMVILIIWVIISLYSEDSSLPVSSRSEEEW